MIKVYGKVILSFKSSLKVAKFLKLLIKNVEHIKQSLLGSIGEKRSWLRRRRRGRKGRTGGVGRRAGKKAHNPTECGLWQQQWSIVLAFEQKAAAFTWLSLLWFGNEEPTLSGPLFLIFEGVTSNEENKQENEGEM